MQTQLRQPTGRTLELEAPTKCPACGRALRARYDAASETITLRTGPPQKRGEIREVECRTCKGDGINPHTRLAFRRYECADCDGIGHTPHCHTDRQWRLWQTRKRLIRMYELGLSTTQIARVLSKERAADGERMLVSQQCVYQFMRRKLGIAMRTPKQGIECYGKLASNGAVERVLTEAGLLPWGKEQP